MLPAADTYVSDSVLIPYGDDSWIFSVIMPNVTMRIPFTDWDELTFIDLGGDISCDLPEEFIAHRPGGYLAFDVRIALMLPKPAKVEVLGFTYRAPIMTHIIPELDWETRWQRAFGHHPPSQKWQVADLRVA